IEMLQCCSAARVVVSLCRGSDLVHRDETAEPTSRAGGGPGSHPTLNPACSPRFSCVSCRDRAYTVRFQCVIYAVTRNCDQRAAVIMRVVCVPSALLMRYYCVAGERRKALRESCGASALSARYACALSACRVRC